LCRLGTKPPVFLHFPEFSFIFLFEGVFSDGMRAADRQTDKCTHIFKENPGDGAAVAAGGLQQTKHVTDEATTAALQTAAQPCAADIDARKARRQNFGFLGGYTPPPQKNELECEWPHLRLIGLRRDPWQSFGTSQ
jgi:hypothetical protein